MDDTPPVSIESALQKNWRPLIGWVVATGFAFSLIVMHVFNFLIKIILWHHGDPIPQIDKPDTVLLLEAAGLAATLGGFRTYEKVNRALGGPTQ